MNYQPGSGFISFSALILIILILFSIIMRKRLDAVLLWNVVERKVEFTQGRVRRQHVVERQGAFS